VRLRKTLRSLVTITSTVTFDLLTDHVDGVMLMSQNCDHTPSSGWYVSVESDGDDDDDDVGCGKLLTRPPDLSGTLTSRDIWERVGGFRLFFPEGGVGPVPKCGCLLTLAYYAWLPALLSIRRKVCQEFLAPLKSFSSAGFETANLVSSGKHTNHYTTKANTATVTVTYYSYF
jgi:hypothetical protein